MISIEYDFSFEVPSFQELKFRDKIMFSLFR